MRISSQAVSRTPSPCTVIPPDPTGRRQRMSSRRDEIRGYLAGADGEEQIDLFTGAAVEEFRLVGPDRLPGVDGLAEAVGGDADDFGGASLATGGLASWALYLLLRGGPKQLAEALSLLLRAVFAIPVALITTGDRRDVAMAMLGHKDWRQSELTVEHGITTD
jgi:hypothetical protein